MSALPLGTSPLTNCEGPRLSALLAFAWLEFAGVFSTSPRSFAGCRSGVFRSRSTQFVRMREQDHVIQPRRADL